MTRSCSSMDWEKQSVLRAKRLMRVRNVRGLRSICCVLHFPGTWVSGARCRAYAPFQTALTEQKLHEIYSPTAEELTFAGEQTRGETARVGLLVLLKTFQRLGYFVTLPEVPQRVVAHLTLCAGLSTVPEGLET